jgi:hypothetical protein
MTLWILCPRRLAVQLDLKVPDSHSLPPCSGFFSVPHHHTIRNPSGDRRYPELIVMDSSTSPSRDMKFAELVEDCSLWVPIDLQNGTFNEQRDLSVSMTLVHTCTSFLTSTYTATTEIFTVSLSDNAAETRTQTITASTETWRSTVVETTVVMVPSITIIVTNGVTSEVCPACSQSTASPSRFVKHLHHGPCTAPSASRILPPILPLKLTLFQF